MGTTTSNGRVTEDRLFYQRLVVYQIKRRWVGYPERVMGGGFLLMQIEHINEEFPYTIVRELYTEEQEERIWKELDEYQSNLMRVEDERNRCWYKVLASKLPIELKTIVDNNLVPDESSFLSYYEDGDYFKPHEDKCKITILNWMYKEPKRFEGGELVFTDYNKTIQLESNKAIIFPGKIKHEVNTTSMNEKFKGMGRWCITHFLH